MNYIDEKFSRLTVKNVFKQNNNWYFECECECGNKKQILKHSVTNGLTKSCGCLKKEVDRKNLIKNHSHKASKTRVYTTWQGIKARCLNPNNKRYADYGGRGITICKEWLDPTNFVEWALGNGYNEGLTIDRINNNEGYSPLNCRWVDIKTQSNNRRSNVIIEYEGVNYTIKEICDKLDLPYKTIYMRYKRGERGERLLRPIGTDPQRKGINSKVDITKVIEIKKLLIEGKKRKEISEMLNVSVYIVDSIRRGETWTHINI